MPAYKGTIYRIAFTAGAEDNIVKFGYLITFYALRFTPKDGLLDQFPQIAFVKLMEILFGFE
jgi:hypothetical protein